MGRHLAPQGEVATIPGWACRRKLNAIEARSGSLRNRMNHLWKIVTVVAVLAIAAHARANSIGFSVKGPDFRSDTIFPVAPAAPSGADGITAVVGLSWNPNAGENASRPGAIVVDDVKDFTAFDEAYNDLSVFENLSDKDAFEHGILDWNGELFQLTNDCGHPSGEYPPNLFPHGNQGDRWYYDWPDDKKRHGHEPGGGCGGGGGHGCVTPEPSSSIMLGSGLMVLALGMYWKARQSETGKREV